MPRNPAGELSLGEIRNLIRQHNKVSVIKGVDSKSRSALLKEVSDMGYRVDHAGKKIVRGSTALTTGKAGEVKPNKTTKKKNLIAGGAPPVMTKKKQMGKRTGGAPSGGKTTKKGNARKGQPVGSRLAFDDTKQEANKKKKPPPIPANKRGKKIKPDRSKLIAGGY